MAGSAGTTWLSSYNDLASVKYHGWNNGVGGQTIAGMVAQAATQDAFISGITLAGRVPVIVAHIGTNGVGGSSDIPADVATLATWAAARRAAGWKVIVSTLLDRNDASKGANWAANKLTFDTAMVAGVGGSWDACIDYRSDTNLSTAGGTVAADSTTYFDPDKLHPNSTGYASMRAIAGPVLDSIGTAA